MEQVLDPEVKIGIEKFKAECERRLPAVQMVIPVKPTQGNFLVSLTFNGIRTYVTVSEDDFADWGEGLATRATVEKVVETFVTKVLATNE